MSLSGGSPVIYIQPPLAVVPQGHYARSLSDRKLAGVCGGLAKYLNMDPTLVRILWVVLSLVSVGAGVIGYILLWMLAPEE